jgi:RNA polymerase sigma factor (sigma-70 family)
LSVQGLLVPSWRRMAHNMSNAVLNRFFLPQSFLKPNNLSLFAAGVNILSKMATDDMLLVREYVEECSERAFETLVSRHINLVYSVALRQAHDPHQAEEITQAVFVILAQKAKTLSRRTILPGWLCRTARNVASNSLTIQRRRQIREQEVYMQSLVAESESQTWAQIAPLLDNGLAQLGEPDHNALVLRYFEGRTFDQVAAALGTSEEAAKKRVTRAVERLRVFFKKHGFTLSAAAIAAALSSSSLQAAPVGLAASVTAAAIHGAPVTGSTLTIINTTLKIMAWTKIKSSVLVGAIVLAVAGGATVVMHAVEEPTIAKRVPPFAFAGYATPEAALKTWLWAMSTGDFEKVQECFTPEQKTRAKTKLEGKSSEDVRKGLISWARNMVDYQIEEKEEISSDEVRLHLVVPPYPGHPNVGHDVQVMQKIGKEWKYAGKYGVDISDK